MLCDNQNKHSCYGRDVIIESICFNAKKRIRFSLIWIGVALVFSFPGLVDESKLIFIIMFLIFSVGGFGLLTSGILDFFRPTYATVIIKNPRLLDIADLHYSKLTYEDQIVKISNGYISITSNPSEIHPLDSLYNVYMRQRTSNFVIVERFLVFVFDHSFVSVNISNIEQSKLNITLNELARSAKLMRVGYTPDNMKYVEEMRKKRNK